MHALRCGHGEVQLLGEVQMWLVVRAARREVSQSGSCVQEENLRKSMSNRIRWSKQSDPNNWNTEGGSIWVGHPAIARGIVRLMCWAERMRMRIWLARRGRRRTK